MTDLTKAEVQAKCTPADIAANDCSVMAGKINEGRVRMQKVAIADIQAYLQTNGVWLPLKSAAADPANPVHVPALALVEAATARFDNIDTTLPIVAQIFGGLVQGGIMTQAQADAIVGMGTVPDPVTAFQVAQALEGV